MKHMKTDSTFEALRALVRERIHSAEIQIVQADNIDAYTVTMGVIYKTSVNFTGQQIALNPDQVADDMISSVDGLVRHILNDIQSDAALDRD